MCDPFRYIVKHYLVNQKRRKILRVDYISDYVVKVLYKEEY